MSNLPIIRIEMEGMRAAIMHMLSERQIQMDAYVAESIDRYVKHQLAADIDRQVSLAISEAIKAEAERHFRYGAGREFIAAAVVERLGIEAKP